MVPMYANVDFDISVNQKEIEVRSIIKFENAVKLQKSSPNAWENSANNFKQSERYGDNSKMMKLDPV